jgi:hypothetical protein
MASSVAFPWRRLAPTVWQWLGASLRSTPQFLRARLSVPYVVGIGAVCFLLPYALWWLTPISRSPAQPRMPAGVEMHQLLTALHTALGQFPKGAPTPFALQDAEVTLHFVVQKSAASGASPYRLVPVDTAVQVRPEHVQTLTMRLLPAASLPTTRESLVSATSGARPSEEPGLRPPALAKKRARP